mmetsp:Transcript_6715/g.19387  ORF Transcript_6715/g.19387 Transcript_6715/m.19387 type:complete len:221 (-) Transcript_6715:473-1135(-)
MRMRFRLRFRLRRQCQRKICFLRRKRWWQDQSLVFPVQERPVAIHQIADRQCLLGRWPGVFHPQNDLVDSGLNVLSRNGLGFGEVLQQSREGGFQVGIVPHNGLLLVDFVVFFFIIIFFVVIFFVVIFIILFVAVAVTVIAVLQVGNRCEGSFSGHVLEPIVLAVVGISPVLGHVKILVVVFLVVVGLVVFVFVAFVPLHGILVRIPRDHVGCRGRLVGF